MSFEDMFKEFNEWLVEKLESIPSDTERFVLFIAWISSVLERYGCRIVVTGGFAVELYTGAVYRTLDVDLIVEGRNCDEKLRKFLEMIANRGLRVYIPRLRSLASKGIDIVSTVYTRPRDPVEMVVIVNGRRFRLWLDPPEELVIRYLCGWKFWNSSEDRDKVFALLAALRDKLDMDYLRKRALEEDVYDKLIEAVKEMNKGTRIRGAGS